MRIHAEANLSALIESTDDLIWSVDVRYRLITFNRAFKEYFELHFGGPVAPGIGMRELLMPARAVLWYPLYDRALRGEKFRANLPLSDDRTIELSFNPIVVDNEISGVSVFGKDITERSRAEVALAESEARFRTFFEENSMVMFLADPETGEIVAANRAACEYYGYPKERFIGMFTHQISLSPPSRTRADRQRALRKECSCFYYSHRLASGEVREIELHSSPFAVDGKPLLCAVVTDITERKQAERALGESEGMFRAITDASPLAIVSTTGSRELVRYMNPTFTRLFGYTVAEIPSVEEWWQLAYPDPEYRQQVKSEWDRKVARAIEQHTSTEPMEVVVTCKDGSKKTVVWGFVSVGDRHLSYAQDLTEHKQAEMLVRDSEERFRATFEQAAVGILHTSFEGRILRSNQRFAAIVGYSQEEVTGLYFQQITPPEDMDSALAVLDRLATGAVESETWEKRYIRKDGSFTWVRMTASIQRNGEGRPLHFIAFVEDINDRKRAEARLEDATAALRRTEERYRTAFQTSIDTIGISRMEDGLYIDVNDAFLHVFGYSREEVVGHTAPELHIWADLEDRQRWIEVLRRDSVCMNMEAPLLRKGGERIWGRISASIIELDGVPCVLTVSRDITEEKAAKERLTEAVAALRLSEERYRTAFQTSIDAININRLNDGMYIDCNQAFLDIVGYTREDVIGKTSIDLDIWANPRDRRTMIELLRQGSGCRGFEAQFRKKSGEVFWGQMSASAMEIDGVPCVLTITRDLSSAKAAESAIRSLAYYDPLTGLPNRRLLMERMPSMLGGSIRSGSNAALLMIDLNSFKTLNDTLGHPTGDLLLQEAARRIASCCQGAGEAYRLGSDEFVVLLEGVSDVDGQAMASAEQDGEKILATLGQPYVLDGREFLLGACIGIALLGGANRSADEILQQADIALHQAKAAGRNSIRFFSPALQAAVNSRAALEESLRQAIKTEQFQLYYQPQMEQGRVIGAEALIRWNHPERGVVPPNEFIPLAEETRMILPLGDWVLEAACRQIAAWAGNNETAHLCVAVNISALQFRQPEFVQLVLATLERTGANPKNLKLELTESILVENIEEVIARMAELRQHGLCFSLDDFGTGYSSLAYLKRLPLDELKIDRAFVHDMLVDATSGAIAQTIISLGRAMGLSVMAEGVETEEQRGFLAALGCHAFQGYLFSRPLPLDDFAVFVESFAGKPAASRK